MATIHSLATETLIQIFEDLDQLRIPEALRGARPSMCSCALVCRAWRAPAQLVLFGEVTLVGRYTDGSYPFSIQKSPRSVTIDWLFSAARTRYRTKHLTLPGGLPFEFAKTALYACPNLETLKLDNLDPVGYHWTEDLFRVPCFEVLRELSLGIYSPPPASAPLPSRLRSLKLNFSILDTADEIPDLPLENILGASTGTLKSLRCTSLEDRTAANALITYFSSVPFPSLTLLTFEHSYPTHTVPLFGALLRLKSPSIEELSFGMAWFWQQPSDWEWISSLHDLVELSRFPRLRHLRLPFAPEVAFEREAGIALLKLCKERSIAVLSKDGYIRWKAPAEWTWVRW